MPPQSIRKLGLSISAKANHLRPSSTRALHSSYQAQSTTTHTTSQSSKDCTCGASLVRRQPPYYSSYETLATASILDETTAFSRLRRETTIVESFSKKTTESAQSHRNPDVPTTKSSKMTAGTYSDASHASPDIHQELAARVSKRESIWAAKMGAFRASKEKTIFAALRALKEKTEAEKYYDV